MSKRRKRETELPGNDGKWFLELVGADEPAPDTATTLAGLSSANATVEIVDGTATTGGHGGVVLSQDVGAETASESTAVAVTAAKTVNTTPASDPRPPPPVESDGLDDWQPDDLSRSLRSKRSVRWTVLILVVVLGAAAVFAAIQLPRIADREADQVANSYRSSMVDVRNELPNTQEALATLTDPQTDEAQLSSVVPATARLEALANSVARLASEPLSPTVPFLPWDPMMDLEPTRGQMEFIGASGEQIAARIGRGYIYRTTVPLLLLTPDLPTEVADSQTINALSVDLASSLADSVDLVASLPPDPAFVATREAAVEYVERFQGWIVDYLSALRAGDLALATSLVAEMSQMQNDLELQTAQSLVLLRTSVDAQIIELATDIEATIIAMPF